MALAMSSQSLSSSLCSGLSQRPLFPLSYHIIKFFLNHTMEQSCHRFPQQGCSPYRHFTEQHSSQPCQDNRWSAAHQMYFSSANLCSFIHSTNTNKWPCWGLPSESRTMQQWVQICKGRTPRTEPMSGLPIYQLKALGSMTNIAGVD